MATEMNPLRPGLVRRRLDWRACVAILAVVLIGSTAAVSVGHGEHAPDQDCAVCHLRHHAVADLSAPPEVTPLNTPEAFRADGTVVLTVSDPQSQTPARSPPAR